MASTKSALYAVTQDVRDAVSPTMESIHPVSRPQINSDLIDRVQVEGTVTFDARRTDAGWEMLSPYVYPLSDALMDNLMSQLDGIRFANWLGKAENMDLKALGLEDYTTLSAFIGVEEADLTNGILYLGGQTSAVLVG